MNTDARKECAIALNRLAPGRRLARQNDVRLIGEHRGNAFAKHGVVIDAQHRYRRHLRDYWGGLRQNQDFHRTGA